MDAFSLQPLCKVLHFLNVGYCPAATETPSIVTKSRLLIVMDHTRRAEKTLDMRLFRVYNLLCPVDFLRLWKGFCVSSWAKQQADVAQLVEQRFRKFNNQRFSQAGVAQW